ncbi:Protein FAM24A, partial [Heterocephalus glaber]
KMSDLSTKIIISMGFSLVIAAVFLTAIVTSIFFYVSKALKAAKEPDPEANSANNTKDRVIPAETAATESFLILQSCDECKMYADPLPPCFCDIN